MTEKTQTDVGVQLSERAGSSEPALPRVLTRLVWVLFLLSVGVLALSVWDGYAWAVPSPFAVDGLTAVLWVVVTFFSGIVHSFSRRYMAGNRHVERFFARVFAFTLAVMLMAAADHVALFAAAWLAMGLLMASLIGHDREWDQARAAGRLARRYFLASSALLVAGLSALAWTTGTASISGVLSQLDGVSTTVALAAAGALILAAMIQSALLPFHRWLLSSMTAPTPASALMHAGFVNAGGILLTRFAPLFSDRIVAMSVLVLVGALSALLGQAMLLVQSDVKRELGSSTIAQMGFMIMQCGLGFFAAAIVHLALHGFYKAYLFLSSGSAVEQTAPTDHEAEGPRRLGLAVSALTAVGAGALFAVLTGKGLHADSGLVLALVVVLTTLHAARDLLGRTSLSPVVRTVATPGIVLVAVGVYGTLFNAVTAVVSDVPATTAPTELTAVNVAVGALFVAAYAAAELDLHRRSERLYVALLNVSQPDPETVLTRTEDYHDA